MPAGNSDKFMEVYIVYNVYNVSMYQCMAAKSLQYNQDAGAHDMIRAQSLFWCIVHCTASQGTSSFSVGVDLK